MPSHGRLFPAQWMQRAFRRPRVAGLALAVLILGFGIATFDRQSTTWALASTALFSIPLACQFLSSSTVRAYSLWLGAFLIAQTVASAFVESDFRTLPPSMRRTVDVRAADMYGISAGRRIVTTDEMGFRVQPRVDYANIPGTRIFAIGGSTTEEILIDDHQTWTHLLQENLRRQGVPAVVVNTGVSGLRAINHLATARAVERFQPDVALFLLGANDWNRQIKRRFEAPPERRLLRPFRETLLGALVSRAAAPVRRALRGGWEDDEAIVISGPGGYKAVRRSLERPTRHEFRPAAVSDEYASHLERIGDWCKATKTKCVFATQANGYSHAASAQFLAGLWMTPPYAEYTLDLDSMIHIAKLYNDHLEAFARRHGFALCDLASRLASTHANFYDDMHYTESGAANVAAIMTGCLARVISSAGGN